MDRISYWWYIIGVAFIGLVLYTNTDWSKGLLCLFIAAFLFKLLVHWLINKYVLHKANKICSAINESKSVMELDLIMKKIIKQKNLYVLKKAEQSIAMRITDETVIPLPLLDTVCNGRICFYKLSALVWLNPRKQTEWTQMFVFNDSIDFIASGHFSYSLSDIVDFNMEDRNQLCLMIRHKADGVFIRSDSAFLLSLVIEFLKKN